MSALAFGGRTLDRESEAVSVHLRAAMQSLQAALDEAERVQFGGCFQRELVEAIASVDHCVSQLR